MTAAILVAILIAAAVDLAWTSRRAARRFDAAMDRLSDDGCPNNPNEIHTEESQQ